MKKAYRIVLACNGRDDFSKRLKNAVKNSAKSVMGTSQLLEFASDLGDNSVPQVVACLCSEGGTKDHTWTGLIEEAITQNVSILPIVKGEITEHITDVLPEKVSHINAAFWTGDGRDVAARLLEMLGIAEVERKLFIT